MRCRCEDTARLDGDDAAAYATGHLELIERERGDIVEYYVCPTTRHSWIMDFPLRHWAADRRGRPRLRREPFDIDRLPIGALDR